MKPTFTLKLGQPIQSNLITVGKFDGKTPSLACVTTGGKILIHSPHEVVESNGQLSSVKFLNINRQVSAIAAGRLTAREDEGGSDYLFVGSASNLLAYDVERNADIFFAEVQDGVSAMCVGKVGSHPQSMVVAGGNCSILGFDHKGNENFWTVTGDNVSAIALADMDKNNCPHVLVGSDDFEIRIYKNEEVIHEVTEADKVTQLHSIDGPKFAYGLVNGTVGVYTNPKNRQWRVKTKHCPTSVVSYDIDLDGIEEIFSGWTHGGFNVRKQDNGAVLFREMMDAPISSILKCDYRMDGNEEIMIAAESGEIRAYLPTDVDFGALFDSGINKDQAADQKVFDELHQTKLELLAELKLLEKVGKNGTGSNSGKNAVEVPVGALPPNTNLSYQLIPDLELKAVALRIDVNTDVQIVNVIAIDQEGVVMVEREAIAISPRPQSKSTILPLRPSRNLQCKIRVQTHVASRSLGTQLHVFETDLQLPKFASFAWVADVSSTTPPAGKLIFTVREPVDRFCEWVNSSFLLANAIPVVDDKLKIAFRSVIPLSSTSSSSSTAAGSNIYQDRRFNNESSTNKDGELLVIMMQKMVESNRSTTKVKVFCDRMDLAADVIQDMAVYFKWSELDSEADFPAEFEAFDEVVKRVAECNSMRTNITADMAEDSQRIKALVIRAEDSRLMTDMIAMRKAYTELLAMNNQLIGGYTIRASNHEVLLTSLKEVNQMIQRAANLRVGSSKTRLVTDCRGAVKSNNMVSLFRILKHGYEPSSMVAQSK